MKKVVKKVPVVVGAATFVVEFHDDYEVSFYRADRGLDELGCPHEKYDRLPTDAKTAVALFRKVGDVIANYLWEAKPPYLYYTAGWDVSRFSLYRRLAGKLAEVGYDYVEDPERPNIFYAYKKGA